MLLYWIIVIMGLFDLEIFDFDVDSLSEFDIFSGLFIFFNAAELPFMFFLSILVLNFWILSMLVYYLPIATGSFVSGVILILAFILSMFLTKYLTMPLKGIFKASDSREDGILPIINHTCTLRCGVSNNKLGQAEIKREGAATVVNVKAEVRGESFDKGEVAFICRKDTKKNMYYIIKLRGEK